MMMQSVEDEDAHDGSSNPAFVSDDGMVAPQSTASNGDLQNPKPKVNPFSIQE